MMVAFWKIKMSEIKNAHFRQKLAETLMRQIDWSDSPPQASTFVEVCTKLRSAQNKIRTIRKQANKHRSKFLGERAAAEALAATTRSSTSRRLERAEATKACYQLLRKYLKPTIRGGITKIEVEEPSGESTTITEPDDMINRILQRNKRHFSQATGTPFTQAPLTTLLGTCGETRQGIELIQGNDQPQLGADAHFPETQVMLDAFNRLPHQASLYRSSLCIRLQEVFKKWDENTSTSPSGKHLALQSTPLLAHQEPSLTDPADDIINLKIKLCQLASQTDMSGIDGKGIVSVMIEKKPGVFYSKTRTIHLRSAITTGHSASYLVVAWSTMNNKTI
jgi:hypothetical protein